jgi:oligopeptidase A
VTDSFSAAANPLLTSRGLPRFADIRAEHVAPAVRHALELVRQGLDDLEAKVEPTFEATVVALRDLYDPLGRAWGVVSHLMGVANTPELREAYESVQPEVVELSLRFSQSEPFYRALRTLRDSGARWDALSPAAKRIVDQRLQAAELSGIALEGPERARFNEIVQRLSALGTQFSNSLLDATQAWGLDLDTPERVAGLTVTGRRLLAQAWNRAHERDDATAETGPWRATLDAPCFLAVIEYAEDSALREAVYRGWISRAAAAPWDNGPLLQEILSLRQEKARLLGFEHFAALSLSSKMASLDAVLGLSERLREAAMAHAPAELQAVQDFAASQGAALPLAHWDYALWRRRLREATLELDEEALRPWFPLDQVLEGLFGVLHRLFDVRIEPDDGTVQVWHPDVRYYHVTDPSGARIAGFYLDAFARPGLKRPGAWMGECQERWLRSDGLQIPVAYLTCNQTPPAGGQPSLMTFDEVETLFHEFGHGLQHMLTQVSEPEVAGISGVEWDAVELPSQFMENWCYHRPTLLGMARHWETGEPLPDGVFEKLVATRTFQAGTMMLRQLMLGLTDLRLHTDYDASAPDADPFQVMHAVAASTSVLPPLPEDRFLCSFSHIFAGGYAAGYYSYKWAEVLSADAFGAFVEAGLDDDDQVRRTGHRFRDTVLALGGSQHPVDVYRAFRGRDPSPEPLLRQYGLAG